MIIPVDRPSGPRVVGERFAKHCRGTIEIGEVPWSDLDPHLTTLAEYPHGLPIDGVTFVVDAYSGSM